MLRSAFALPAALTAILCTAAVATTPSSDSAVPARPAPLDSDAGIGGGTTLLLWPAGPPEFGQLPGGGPGTTVLVANLATGAHHVGRIPQIAPGDFPVPFARSGRWLVYNGSRGVSAVRASLSGAPRRLGAATYFVPAATPGRIWLVRQDPASGLPSSLRPVSVGQGRLGPVTRLPRGTAGADAGTKAGLLLVSRSGALELWQPGNTPRALAKLGPTLAGAGFANDSRVVVYGRGCRLREATSGFAHTPVGYETCATLEAVDLITKARFSFPAPAGTVGWAPAGFGADNAVAPGDTMLAAQAVIPPARKAQTRLYLLRLNRRAAPRPVPSSTAPLYARTAWSADGSWLLYQGARSRLAATQIATGHTHTFAIRCCRYTAMIATHTPPS